MYIIQARLAQAGAGDNEGEINDDICFEWDQIRDPLPR